MFVVILREFEIAFEKAAEVNRKIKRQENGFVELSEITEVVKRISCYDDIRVDFKNFSAVKDLANIGAMLSTQDKDGKKTANILINSSNSAKNQRFSMAHELGHLITGVANYQYETPNDGKFTISSHINSDITFISDNDCKKDQYIMAEQIANIFALLVLIPDDITIKKLAEESEEKLSSQYGVTTEAMYSRMLLSVMKR